MRNPLIKRLPKEFKNEFGKYLVIFLFMIGTIGFISGFLVADNSIVTSYNDSFEKYNIEDGNFECTKIIDNDTVKDIEKDGDVKLYKNYYIEEKTGEDNGKEIDSTLRIFKNRNEIDKVCLMEGAMPDSDKDIAIDRMYAENNKISIGDEFVVGNKKLKVTGLVALSDYSALFSNNSDTMFDAVKFGVAIMSENGFNSLHESRTHYNYSWSYNEKTENDENAKTKSEDFMDVLNKKVILKNYIPAFANQAIHFTGNDLGSDKGMILTLLYILVVIMAFVFAITTNNTITNESAVIGTLRASGYTKGEMIRHYLTIPLFVSIVSSIIGNILGYTFFKNLVAAMYYGSYSLPTYKTIWNAEAFVLTTVVPFIIMMFINSVLLVRKLSLSPLKFLRRDLKKKQKNKAIKLPNFKFINRFRLRIIFQNMPGYIMLLIGIIFANILLLFGMMMSPLLDNYKSEIIDNMLSDYQYILKMPQETKNKSAEKFCLTSLKTTFDDKKEEDVTIYGIEDNSKYIDSDLPKDGVYVSNGVLEKYSLKEGDTVKLKEKYGSEEYSFTVKGTINYPSGLCLFMPRKEFNEVFDKDKGYYNGYFSNEELSDINNENIDTEITKDDLTKTTRQLEVSIGNTFYMVNVFAIILYMILIYLLCKLIIEKNKTSISMLKILGYDNKEVSKLYILSNTIVVVVSILVSMPIASLFMKFLYNEMMAGFSGWLTYYINPVIYIKMFIMGICAYVVVAAFEYRKIKKIPMAEALKNVE